MSCPCGHSLPYEQCCGQYIDAALLPKTPEALMRSRYTAFVFSKIDYLANTMRGEALKKFHFDGLDNWLNQIKWQGLTIIKSTMRGNIHGFVSFEASYLENGKTHLIREKSEFKKLEGKWFYIDGKIMKG